MFRSHICYECCKSHDSDASDWQTVRCKACQKATRRAQLVYANEPYDEQRKVRYRGSSQKWKKGQNTNRGKIDND